MPATYMAFSQVLLAAACLLANHVELGVAADAPAELTIPRDFVFPACVDVCVFASGCKLDDPRCMCRSAANSGFLDAVVRCMPKSCTSRTVSAEDSFIKIVEDGCRNQKTPVPGDALSRARSLAASLGLLRPPSSTTAPAVNPQRSSSLPRLSSTTTMGSPAVSSQRSSSPATTQTASRGDGDPDDDRGSASSSPTAPTPQQPTSSNSNTPTQPPAPARPPPTEPTDSSPFAAPIGSSSRTTPISLYWALTSVLAGMALVLR